MKTFSTWNIFGDTCTKLEEFFVVLKV